MAETQIDLFGDTPTCPHWLYELRPFVMTSGASHLVCQCIDCGTWFGKNFDQKLWQVGDVPIDPGDLQRNPPAVSPLACARCGSTTGIELHHWAPKALFEDAERWPKSPLCRDCHDLWHRITRFR